LRLLWQEERRAFSLALPKTGKRIDARIAMMAITTRSSMRVKAVLALRREISMRKSPEMKN
jgi:hypothetical protein